MNDQNKKKDRLRFHPLMKYAQMDFVDLRLFSEIKTSGGRRLIGRFEMNLLIDRVADWPCYYLDYPSEDREDFDQADWWKKPKPKVAHNDESIHFCRWYYNDPERQGYLIADMLGLEELGGQVISTDIQDACGVCHFLRAPVYFKRCELLINPSVMDYPQLQRMTMRLPSALDPMKATYALTKVIYGALAGMSQDRSMQDYFKQEITHIMEGIPEYFFVLQAEKAQSQYLDDEKGTSPQLSDFCDEIFKCFDLPIDGENNAKEILTSEQVEEKLSRLHGFAFRVVFAHPKWTEDQKIFLWNWIQQTEFCPSQGSLVTHHSPDELLQTLRRQNRQWLKNDG